MIANCSLRQLGKETEYYDAYLQIVLDQCLSAEHSVRASWELMVLLKARRKYQVNIPTLLEGLEQEFSPTFLQASPSAGDIPLQELEISLRVGSQARD